MEMAVTHQLTASLKWSFIDWNHVLGSVVLKDSPCDVVASWLNGSGATLNTSLTSVSGNMGCACICVGISHSKYQYFWDLASIWLLYQIVCSPGYIWATSWGIVVFLTSVTCTCMTWLFWYLTPSWFLPNSLNHSVAVLVFLLESFWCVISHKY